MYMLRAVGERYEWSRKPCHKIWEAYKNLSHLWQTSLQAASYHIRPLKTSNITKHAKSCKQSPLFFINSLGIEKLFCQSYGNL